MIHRANHLFFQNVLQVFEIDHHTRYGVGIAFDRDFQDVVVAMSIRISFFAKKPPIFRVIQRGYPADMGGGKFSSSSNEHH